MRHVNIQFSNEIFIIIKHISKAWEFVGHAHLQSVLTYSWETVLLFLPLVSLLAFPTYSAQHPKILCMYNEFWQCIRWWKWVCMNASLLRVAAPWSRVQHDLHSGSGLSNSGVPEPPSHPWLYPKSRKSGENRARKRRKNRRARSTHRKKDTPLAAPKTPYPKFPSGTLNPVIFPVKPYKNCFLSLIGNKFACLAYGTKEEKGRKTESKHSVPYSKNSQNKHL